MASDTRPTANHRAAFAVVTTLFFMWGFITVLVDALIPRLRAVFDLSYFEAGLVQFAFFTAYLVMSIPSGFLIARIGYKKGVVVGLLTMALGCALFYPAADLRVFAIFLAALFVLASGITVLQVAANPYVAALGPESSASSRLNLSQAFNSLGTTIAPLVSAAFILGTAVSSGEQIAAMTDAARQAYYDAEAAAVQAPFVTLALVLAVLAGLFALFRLPRVLDTDDEHHGTYRGALSHRNLVLGAVGIFVYVGAEVAIGSYLVNLFLELDIAGLAVRYPGLGAVARLLSGTELGEMTADRLAGTFVVFYWGGAMVGRFLGAWLMRFVRPGRLLGSYAVVASVLLAISIVATGITAVWAVLAIGLFNSIMFPTIFTLAIEGTGEHTAPASGVLCTAIVGGAVIPPLYGAAADAIGLQPAFALLIACYLYIAYYGFRGSRPAPRRPATAPARSAAVA